MTPTRCTVITALCLLWPTLSHAQRVPTPADVRARLHSRDAAEVAWAAFDAATFQMREVAPDLIAVLELPPPADPLTRDYLSAAILDALIQAGTAIPVAGPAVAFPETLERYYSRWPVQTLILFGRERDEQGPILQRLLASTSGQEWFALANLLLSSQAPVPGFAATLLRGVNVTFEIVVVDPGLGAGLGIGGGGGGDGGITLDRGPTGFPPHAVYAFESGDNVGAIVLSRGPRTVYYSRRIEMRWPSGREGPTTEDRLAYLNVLLRATDYSFRSRLRPRTSVSITWTNERALRDAIATEQKKIFDEYERMLQALMDLGYLTAEETNSLPLALDTEIHDLRSNRDRPLQ